MMALIRLWPFMAPAMRLSAVINWQSRLSEAEVVAQARPAPRPRPGVGGDDGRRPSAREAPTSCRGRRAAPWSAVADRGIDQVRRSAAVTPQPSEPGLRGGRRVTARRASTRRLRRFRPSPASGVEVGQQGFNVESDSVGFDDGQGARPSAALKLQRHRRGRRAAPWSAGRCRPRHRSGAAQRGGDPAASSEPGLRGGRRTLRLRRASTRRLRRFRPSPASGVEVGQQGFNVESDSVLR